MSKLILIDTKLKENILHHASEDLELDSELIILKNILKGWVLVRERKGEFTYKGDSECYKTLCKYVEFQKKYDDSLEELYQWLHEGLMFHDIRDCEIYFIGSNLSIIGKYDYYVCIKP